MTATPEKPLTSPGFVLSDGWPDSAPEERVWVAVADAPAGGHEAIEVARRELDGWMEVLDDDDLELIATDRQEWHRQAPCMTCDGRGADDLPILPAAGDAYVNGWPVRAEGPAPACESCRGTGQQDGDDGYRYESCAPDDEGAVLFWVLEVAERERSRSPASEDATT